VEVGLEILRAKLLDPDVARALAVVHKLEDVAEAQRAQANLLLDELGEHCFPDEGVLISDPLNEEVEAFLRELEVLDAQLADLIAVVPRDQVSHLLIQLGELRLAAEPL